MVINDVVNQYFNFTSHISGQSQNFESSKIQQQQQQQQQQQPFHSAQSPLASEIKRNHLDILFSRIPTRGQPSDQSL